MDVYRAIDVLNELLAAEQRGLPRRLLEATVFISPPALGQLTAVQVMARQSEEHGAILADLIIRLGGVPGMRVGDTHSADLHFQHLHNAWPRLVGDRESLIRKYARAAEYVSFDPDAAEAVSQILESHRRELASLQQLAGRDARATT